jgi:hypothetical protein
MHIPQRTPPSPGRDANGGLWAARAAFVVGALYAAVSVYWGLGGTWLLDTVGGSLARLGRAHDATVIVAVWVTACLKLTAALLPLVAIRAPRGRTARVSRLLAWISGAILTTYGAVLTVVGLLVQADVIHRSAGADRRALAWHAYFWDPWFLLWGLLIVTALLRNRAATAHRARHPASARSGQVPAS